MPSLVRKSSKDSQQADFLPKARRIAHYISEKKAEQIVGYDVRGLTLVTDCFILCTANSEPQMKAIAESVHDGMKEIGVGPLHREGAFSGAWLLVDYGDVIVHVFREEARAFYDLDGLWGDAPRVDLEVDDAA